MPISLKEAQQLRGGGNIQPQQSTGIQPMNREDIKARLSGKSAGEIAGSLLGKSAKKYVTGQKQFQGQGNMFDLGKIAGQVGGAVMYAGGQVGNFPGYLAGQAGQGIAETAGGIGQTVGSAFQGDFGKAGQGLMNTAGGLGRLAQSPFSAAIGTVGGTVKQPTEVVGDIYNEASKGLNRVGDAVANFSGAVSAPFVLQGRSATDTMGVMGDLLHQGRRDVIGGSLQIAGAIPGQVMQNVTPLRETFKGVGTVANEGMNNALSMVGVDPNSDFGQKVKEEAMQIVSLGATAYGLSKTPTSKIPTRKQMLEGSAEAVKRTAQTVAEIVKGEVRGGAKFGKETLGIAKNIADRLKSNFKPSDKKLRADMVDFAGKITQAKTKSDRKSAVNALSEFSDDEIKKIKPGAEGLYEALDKKGRELQKIKKAILEENKKRTKLDDLGVDISDGDITVQQNYVADAFDELQDYYEGSNDKLALAKLMKLKDKAQNIGLTPNEIDDIAIQYNRKVTGLKGYAKSGASKTGMTPERVQNTATGIKETSRGFFPDDVARDLDKRISDIITTENAMEKVVEKLSNIQNKIEKRGFAAQVANNLGHTIDNLTGNAASSLFKSALMKSNAGFKTMNYLDIDKNINKYLKNINKLNSELGKIKITSPSVKDSVAQYVGESLRNMNQSFGTTIPSYAKWMKRAQAGASQYADDFKENIGSSTRGSVAVPKALQKKGEILDDVNPTGSVFTEYKAAERANMKLGKNITTLDKTSSQSPDSIVTIYRGAPKSQKSINPGDFITTNKQLAKDYAGTGHVISKEVRMMDVLDDVTEPLGEEYIYRPQLQKDISSNVNKIQSIKSKFPEVDLSIYDGIDEISLSKIVVPKKLRNTGIGTRVMNDLVKYADDNGKRIVLTPTKDFGGSVYRLRDFYKRFGFVENKGKYKDFSIRDTMYRIPK